MPLRIAVHPGPDGGPFRFEQSDLEEAFDAVRDRDDWRAPIQAEIQQSEVLIVCAAITHFTGTVAELTNLADGLVEVRSVGYRAGPCGP